MIRVLFPEYTLARIPIWEDRITFDQSWYNGQGGNIKHGKYILIHWFEFASNYLAWKILKNDHMALEFFQGCTLALVHWEEKGVDGADFDKVHPIDFLYEHFLKLK